MGWAERTEEYRQGGRECGPKPDAVRQLKLESDIQSKQRRAAHADIQTHRLFPVKRGVPFAPQMTGAAR